MNKLLLAVVVTLASVVVEGAKFESFSSDAIRVSAFVAKGDGIFAPEDGIKFALKGDCDCPVRVKIGAVDFYGKAVDTGVADIELPSGKFAVPLELNAPGKLGHFTVSASFFSADKCLGFTQSAFVVAPPEPARADPYYVVDQNSAVTELVAALRRVGFGAHYLPLRKFDWAIEATPEQREEYYRSLEPGARTGNLALKGLTFIGGMSPNVKGTKHVKDRVARGLYPVSDEDLALAREHARRMASVLADVIDVWLIQEEFDAFKDVPSIRDDLVHYFSANALISENLIAGLRSGNANCKIGVLGICCNDYLVSRPPFRLSRMMLAPIRGLYDFVALDSYTGGWNGTQSGVLNPPENLLAKLFVDGAKLSAEFGGRKEVWNAERCYALDYAAAFDSSINRQHAVLTARSMIVNRAVPEAKSYTLHLVALPSRAKLFLANREKYLSSANLYDMGAWKPVQETPNGKTYYSPRATVAASGTVARELAFVREPTMRPLKNGAYACVFTREDGKPVAALWSTNTVKNVSAEAAIASNLLMGDGDKYTKEGELVAKEVPPILTIVKHISLSLPAGGTVTDLMGNSRRVEAGKLDLSLDESPVFVVSDGPRAELEAQISGF